MTYSDKKPFHLNKLSLILLSVLFLGIELILLSYFK